MIREPRTGSAEVWKPEDESYVSFTAGLASGPGGRGSALEVTVTTKGHSALEWRTGQAGWVDHRTAVPSSLQGRALSTLTADEWLNFLGE